MHGAVCCFVRQEARDVGYAQLSSGWWHLPSVIHLVGRLLRSTSVSLTAVFLELSSVLPRLFLAPKAR